MFEVVLLIVHFILPSIAMDNKSYVHNSKLLLVSFKFYVGFSVQGIIFSRYVTILVAIRFRNLTAFKYLGMALVLCNPCLQGLWCGFGYPGTSLTSCILYLSQVYSKLNWRKYIFNCGSTNYNVDCLGRSTNH